MKATYPAMVGRMPRYGGSDPMGNYSSAFLDFARVIVPKNQRHNDVPCFRNSGNMIQGQKLSSPLLAL
jgi:hypothetical protein